MPHMGQKRQKTTGVTRAQTRPRRWVRRSLLGAGALAAVGALAACSGVATNEAQAPDAFTKLASAAGSGTVQSHGAPAIVSRAIAHGRIAQPTRRAAHRHGGHPTPSSSATATATGTPTATPSGTPTATPTGTATPTRPADRHPDRRPERHRPLRPEPGHHPVRLHPQVHPGIHRRAALPANWRGYTGVPGGETSSEADWEPSMCSFSGGEAHFMASGIDSCGMSYLGEPQEYGAWFARLQGNVEPGRPAVHRHLPALARQQPVAAGDRRLRGQGGQVAHHRHRV